jgi:hypothetical protein
MSTALGVSTSGSGQMGSPLLSNIQKSYFEVSKKKSEKIILVTNDVYYKGIKS